MFGPLRTGCQTPTFNARRPLDRLLSRLMSGKIDLEALDIAFCASMKEQA